MLRPYDRVDVNDRVDADDHIDADDRVDADDRADHDRATPWHVLVICLRPFYILHSSFFIRKLTAAL